MPEPTEFDSLLKTWRGYLAAHRGKDDTSREAGYWSALDLAADQLEETIARVRADTEGDDA
jgi:hypothetical protein